MTVLNNNSADSLIELKSRMQNEPVAEFMGVKLLNISPGYAKATMKMKPEYVNFHGVIQGGIMMTLADFAFGWAVNSVAFPSVASQLNFHFIARAEVNDELTAECRVIKNGRRAGIAEISINNQKGELIVKATGTTIPLS
jgi:acyl-CoA thioesterase